MLRSIKSNLGPHRLPWLHKNTKFESEIRILVKQFFQVSKMNSSARVGEIFTSAGQALNLLGNLTAQLESAGAKASGSGTKWTDQVPKFYPTLNFQRFFVKG